MGHAHGRSPHGASGEGRYVRDRLVRFLASFAGQPLYDFPPIILSHQQFLSRTRRPRRKRSCQSAPSFTSAGTFLAAITARMWTRRSMDSSNLARPRFSSVGETCFGYAPSDVWRGKARFSPVLIESLDLLFHVVYLTSRTVRKKLPNRRYKNTRSQKIERDTYMNKATK